jgi:hypothetical protein
VAVDRLAVGKLHHQVRSPGRRGAAVEQARDVGVLQVGEDLPLAPEPLQRLGAAVAQQDLDGRALLVMAVAALRGKHAAHAAVAHLVLQRPGAEPVAGGEFVVEPAGGGGGHRCGKAGLRSTVAQQRQHALDGGGIGALVGQGGALRGLVGQVADSVEQRLDARVVAGLGWRRREGGDPGAGRRCQIGGLHAGRRHRCGGGHGG